MSINVNDKNLGHATAYAYYKAGGGTMTEAEFTEFMADFGTASQTAVEAAQAALASKNAAQTAATTATNKATEATTAATTATTKAGEASTSASTATSAKDTAVSASQTATTKATEATTAAATATSAATTATTAKDDAVSAKTAAQTAQTGAETAAASVQSSAAQIATNAEDISQLKSDLAPLSHIVLNDGYIVNTSYLNEPTSSSEYKYAIVRVRKGEVYEICGTGASSARLWSTHNYDKATIRMAQPSLILSEPINVTIMEGENYLVFNTASSSLHITLKRTNGDADEITKIKESVNDVFSLFKRDLNIGSPIEKKYINSLGELVGDQNTISYRYIPVIKWQRINLNNIVLEGNRCVVAYNEDKSFNSVIFTNQGASKKCLSFVVGEYSYIGICTKESSNFNVTYNELPVDLADRFSTSDNVGNYAVTDIKLIYKSGYINKYNGIVSDSGYEYIDYVPVYENASMTAKNIRALNGIAIFCYDKDYHLIETVKANDTKLASFTFDVPFNTIYIRFNLASALETSNSLVYNDKILKNNHELQLVNNWYSKAHNLISTPFKSAKAAPIISFTDDDTVSIARVTAYHDACEYASIKGTYAVLASALESVNGLTELLLSYEREGYGSIIHGYTQGVFYRTGESRNIALCEDDIVHGLQVMHNKGFTNYKLWATPFGVSDTDIRNLAKKWGMECLFTSGETDFEPDYPKWYGRYSIRRITLDPTDESGTTLSDLKLIMDNAKTENGWVIINTHFGSYTTWDNNLDRFKEVVDYAVSLGYDIKPLAEAWKIREPIYRLYEMF